MDPKNNQGNKPLDPNLQAAYDRVMGTDVSSPNPAPSTSQPPTDTTTPAPANPVPAATPNGVATLTAEPSMPPMPDLSSVLSDSTAGATQSPATNTVSTPPDVTNPVVSPTTPSQPTEPAAPAPTMPPAPAAPITLIPDLPAVPQAPVSEPSVNPVTPPTPANDTLQATITMPQITHRDTETVQIGGGPVGGVTAAKAKGKGISPVILIFGAFAFLVVYAVFWVKFFNYSLPFLPK